MALPAFARRRCSNRLISPSRWAHSKPKRVCCCGLTLRQTYGRTDGRTDGHRTVSWTLLHIIINNNNKKSETASVRKESKYSSLPPEYLFQPVAIETLGPLNASAVNFLSEVGRRLTSLSGDPRETSFLFQRLSILIQRFNSALITDSFCYADEDPDL